MTVPDDSLVDEDDGYWKGFVQTVKSAMKKELKKTNQQLSDQQTQIDAQTAEIKEIKHQNGAMMEMLEKLVENGNKR